MAWQGEPLFKHFGLRLVKAVVLVLIDEINVLRVKAGLAERTPQQAISAIQAKYDSLQSDDEGPEERP